ncbi:hypothetical protein phiHau3_57 [Streptomyces phage phiHau3]|uniref:Uncharacterized protein n=1 Tax=Streptomyces phage phiHau3 TaxID=1204524 RepID=K4I2I4_9CAUD|nr:hypothetical protein phiHau3_57 [Streptomyces phage phiHau3]AFU62035.1 hypothetical protein phiHau3_57 [Streptomyces phage phiHau3]
MIHRPPKRAPYCVATAALALLILLILAPPAHAPGAETPIVNNQKDVTP